MERLSRNLCWACGKVCYPARGVAKRNGKALRSRHRTKYRAYRCPLCWMWHLTSR